MITCEVRSGEQKREENKATMYTHGNVADIFRYLSGEYSG